MKIRVGINGFGRIGKIVLRNILNYKNIEVVAINDLITLDYLAYQLKPRLYSRYSKKRYFF
jgi:glyceraldehyde 3-phosphate dehydrogenase